MNPTRSTTLQAGILVILLIAFTSFESIGAADSPPPDRISGTVLETMNSAGYTYVNVDTKDGQVWAAIPESTVAAGQEIVLIPGMEMKDFHSNSLNRTFSRIFFSPGAADTAAAPQTNPAPAVAGDDSFAAAIAAERQSVSTQPQPIQPAQGSGGSLGAVVPFQELELEKAAGENAFTVWELFAKSKELNGKPVKVRGQVVKFNANIMGRNWLHIQDGTGDPMQNTHDLVITTTEEVGGPEIITIEGTLVADRDFGAGYTYAVLVEQGVIIE